MQSNPKLEGSGMTGIALDRKHANHTCIQLPLPWSASPPSRNVGLFGVSSWILGASAVSWAGLCDAPQNAGPLISEHKDQRLKD